MKKHLLVGIAFAIVHLALVGSVVRIALSGREPAWPMAWAMFLAIDFPVSLLAFVNIKLPEVNLRPDMPLSPLNDVQNFWSPLFIYGICGTLWWFWLAATVSRRLIRQGSRAA